MKVLFWVLTVLATIHGVTLLGIVYALCLTDWETTVPSTLSDSMSLLLIMSLVLGWIAYGIWQFRIKKND